MSYFLAMETHLPAEKLYRRYREAGRPTEQAQWYMLWLKDGGQSAREIRAVLGYSETWICETVHRYNEEGPKVARWIESVTGRAPVPNQRGWEYLRRLGPASSTSAPTARGGLC